MSASRVFAVCLLVAHFVVLGAVAAVVFRNDIRKWLSRKFRKDKEG